jgi:cell pole-organizing protein PopZ
MSDTNAQEPTMEEILASIRRIISEDEPPAVSAEPAAMEEPEAAEVAADAAEPQPVVDFDDDVLDLTDPIAEPEPMVMAAPEPQITRFEVDDLDVYSPEPVARAVPLAPRPAPRLDDGLVSNLAEAAAASAFGQLAQSVAMPEFGRTLEDVVRELLRPLLKTWLDDNLPAIVQATVDEEVARIARRRS